MLLCEYPCPSMFICCMSCSARLAFCWMNAFCVSLNCWLSPPPILIDRLGCATNGFFCLMLGGDCTWWNRLSKFMFATLDLYCKGTDSIRGFLFEGLSASRIETLFLCDLSFWWYFIASLLVSWMICLVSENFENIGDSCLFWGVTCSELNL